MLEDTLASPDLLSTRAGHRRHALAREAERLIWRWIACGEAGGLSLDALCAELGTTRRTLQRAFQDHFATSVGLVTRSARLQQVRTELGAGTAPAVSETALRSGFDHLRRFALGDAARTATAIGSRLKRKNPVHLSTHGAS